jgi:sialate O-acetylesterase
MCQDSHPIGGSEWVSAHIATVQAEPGTLTLSLSSCPSPRFVVGLRYAWRKTPCPAKSCLVYSHATPSLPMPPYIRFGLVQDNNRHELDRSPVKLI